MQRSSFLLPFLSGGFGPVFQIEVFHVSQSVELVYVSPVAQGCVVRVLQIRPVVEVMHQAQMIGLGACRGQSPSATPRKAQRRRLTGPLEIPCPEARLLDTGVIDGAVFLAQQGVDHAVRSRSVTLVTTRMSMLGGSAVWLKDVMPVTSWTSMPASSKALSVPVG